MASESASIDLNQFLAPNFDAQEYVQKLLSNPYHLNNSRVPLTSQKDEGDLSLAISRLNLAIDEIEGSINEQITQNASQLLKRMTRVSEMESGLGNVRSGVQVLDKQVGDLREKVHLPFDKLVQMQKELFNLDAAGELVSKSSRFVTMAKRLDAQMAVLFGRAKKGDIKENETEEAEQDAVIGEVRGRELARAALIINEITSLIDQEKHSEQESIRVDQHVEVQGEAEEAGIDSNASLIQLEFVKNYLPSIDSARRTVTEYMEDMVVRGLRDLSPIMLSSSLQTAYNLGNLADLVRDLLTDLTEVVKERTRAAFDVNSLSRELGGAKEPAAAPAAYASYKGRRQDSSVQTAQWTEAFWRRLETLIVGEMGAVCSKVYTLEKVLKLKNDSETGVNFLDEALLVLGDKPSLTFWTTFAQSFSLHSREASRRSPFVKQLLGGEDYTRLLRLFQDFFAKVSVYTDIVYTSGQQSPEAVIVLKSLAPFESAFLERSTSKMYASLKTSLSLSSRTPPTTEDAESIVRGMNSALDTARFDPLLLRATIRRIDDFIGDTIHRVETMALTDGTAFTLDAADTTSSQALNAGLASFSVTLSRSLSLDGNQQLARQVDACWQDRIARPLLAAIKTQVGKTIEQIHHGDGGYMTELCEQLWFFREKILARYEIGELRNDWSVQVGDHTIGTFLQHASLLRPPLTESAKLTLTNEMTQLEFAIAQLTPACSVASLRTFRQIIFQETEAVGTEGGVVALQHLLGRQSNAKWPYEKKGWSRAEYLEWLETHSTAEAIEQLLSTLPTDDSLRQRWS